MARSRPGIAAALFLAALGGLPGPAGAQQLGGPVEIGELSLDALLDPQVAAVSLREERASTAPASVFVLTAADLRAQGFQTLAEALRSVPGLFTYSDGFYQYVGVRGTGLLTDYTTRLLILVDGHPLNNTLAVAENSLGPDFLVPLAMVDRIEVVKGPVGSVYGPTAFLGVVNVVTRGAPAGEGQIAVGTGLAQGRLVDGTLAAAGGGRRGDLAVVAGAEASRSRGTTWTFPELALATDRAAPPGGRVAGVDHSDTAKGYLRATWRGLSLQGGCGHWYRQVPSAPYSVLVGEPGNYEESLACFAQLAAERRLSEAWVVSGRLSVDRFDYHDLLLYPEQDPGGGQGLGPFRDTGRDDWLGADLRLQWQPAPGLHLTAGATGERHATSQYGGSERFPPLTVDPVNGVGLGVIRKAFSTVNAYAIAEWHPWREVALHGAFTWYHHQLFGSRLTPKLALLWNPVPGSTLKAIYTEGFRAPTASDAFFDDGSSYLANPALRPETVRSAELVWEQRLAERLSLALSLFRNVYDHLIHFETVLAPGAAPGSTDPLDYRQQAKNGGSFVVAGGELGGTLRLSLLRAHGGVSVQGGTGRPNFPSVTANLALASRALWQPLELAVRGAFASRREKDADTLVVTTERRLGPYLRLDAQATLDVPGVPGLALELGVQNLLEGSPRHPVAYDFTPISSFPEPPRTWRLAARATF